MYRRVCEVMFVLCLLVVAAVSETENEDQSLSNKSEQPSDKQDQTWKYLAKINEQVQTLNSHVRITDSILWEIVRITKELSRNMTSVRHQTKSILIQQNACANSDHMRIDVQRVKSKPINKQDLNAIQQQQQNITFGSCREDTSKDSGKYILLSDTNLEPFEVLCEKFGIGGGWLVFLQHYNGEENFNRSWSEYRNGFGSLDHEFWMGLERLHQLTFSRPYEMMVEVETSDGNYIYVWYKRFEIGSEAEDYMLKNIEYNNATANYSLNLREGLKFTTYDRNTDGQINNASKYGEGRWWMVSEPYEEEPVVSSQMMIREIIE